MSRRRRITTKEAGERLSFKSRTVARWCRDGSIKAEKWGRVWRISEEEMRRLEKLHARA